MNLVSFGDSFPSGYPYGTSYSYGAKAAGALGATHDQRAVNGSKIADVATAIALVTPNTSDIYTVGVGLNDARDNGVGSNGVYAFYQSLLASVTYLAVVPSRVFLFTPSLQTVAGTAGYTAAGGSWEATDSFADAVRQVAIRTGVQLIDAFELVTASDLQADGCHWSDITQYRMGSRIAVRIAST